MRHFHVHPHPHHLSFQQMTELENQFTVQSPLRSLFYSDWDFEYVIDTITTNGPIHECLFMTSICKSLESLLGTLQRDGFEIKPIEDGITITSFSPHHRQMTFPLKLPKSVVEASPNMDASYLADAPPERSLGNLLISNALYYIDLYCQTKERKETL